MPTPQSSAANTPDKPALHSRDKVLGSAESERAVADRFDLVVHAFDGPIRDPDLGPGKDSSKVVRSIFANFLKGSSFDRIAE